jgi:2-dehydro-3-deoxyphosphogluconate aldolase/(4S)-4-hydroxy-2-oxoglutarate aldolase
LNAVEVSMNSPNAVESIARLASLAEVCVGAGTVLDRRTAAQVVDAGVSYLVMPHTDTGLIAWARRRGVAAIPGGLTPTELLNGWRAGASAVKLFPAGAVGPEYVRAVKVPFPEIDVIPTGGVNPKNAAGFLAAGAAAVAIGASLVATSSLDEIEKRAAALVKTLSPAGGQRPGIADGP